MTRSLIDVLKDVIAHGQEQPRHGANCACLDKYIREVRLELEAVMPPRVTPDVSADDWERRFDAECRVRHVLNTAMRMY